MIPIRKIFKMTNVDFLATGSTTTLFTPFNGRKFKVQRVWVRISARTGTLDTATMAVKAGTTDIVAAAIPITAAGAVDTVKDHTVVNPAPLVTYANQLKVVLVAGATSTVAKGDIFIEGTLI